MLGVAGVGLTVASIFVAPELAAAIGFTGAIISIGSIVQTELDYRVAHKKKPEITRDALYWTTQTLNGIALLPAVGGLARGVGEASQATGLLSKGGGQC